MKYILVSMKSARIKFLLFAIFFATLYSMSAQIEVEEYTKEVHCNVNDFSSIAPVKASSPAGPITTNVMEQIFSGGCLGTLVRSYTFSNKFGEQATAEQYIFLTDTDAPKLINVPADIIVKANEIPPPAVVISEDNSGRKCEVFFSEAKTTSLIVRTWTCKDNCDNRTEAVQRIAIIK
jgi:hypothetical protein